MIKSFLNVIGLLALIGGITSVIPESPLAKTNGALSTLIFCTCFGLAKLIDLKEAEAMEAKKHREAQLGQMLVQNNFYRDIRCGVIKFDGNGDVQKPWALDLNKPV